MSAAVTGLRCRAVSVPLGAGPSPAELLRRADGRDGLVGLVGAWADGAAILTSHRVHVLRPDADPIAALDAQPEVDGPAKGFVGSGWFGWLAYDGASRLAFHDHLVRHVAGAWRFEALWSDDRDAVLTQRHALVSLSPELFLRRRGRDVVTAPIKGTLPRDVPGNAERLRGSAKDAAENVMIVDLMRNDLGRVCEPSTVRASALLDVEAHPGVWPLVSTVEGSLRAGVSDADLLRATFPPGSVTGAPKLRAIDAIVELEPRARRAYTARSASPAPAGARSSASPSEPSKSVADASSSAWAAASPPTACRCSSGASACTKRHHCCELREPRSERHVHARRRAHFGAARRRAARDDPRCRRATAAPCRPRRPLDRSCRELYGRGLPQDLADRARAAAAGLPGRCVLRLVAGPDLVVAITTAAIGAAPIATAATIIHREDGLWRHKWADRAALADSEARVAPAVPLFVAADGAVLETSRGNVFLIEPDGTLVTPPLRDDLLPGVTRRALLDLARDDGRPTVLRTFGAAELVRRAAFWASSLSGAVPIRHVDGMASLPGNDSVVAEFAARLIGSEKSVR